MATLTENTFLNTFGDEFFKNLEDATKVKVPKVLKNILLINDIDCAEVLSRVDDETLQHIENFMKHDFSATMITDIGEHPIDQYLGKYTLCQQKFNFSSGHKIILKVMIEHCARSLRIDSHFNATTSTRVQQEKSLVENSHERETRSPEEQAATKKKLVKLLFQSLFSWMKNQARFAEVQSDDLYFQIVEDSYVELDDGTVTCMLKCPVVNCDEECTVTYKAYRSYYNTKKKPKSKQAKTRPRWHLYVMEKHIQRKHNDVPNPTSGAGCPDEEVLPDFNLRENQNGNSAKGSENLNTSDNDGILNSEDNPLENDENDCDVQNNTSSILKDQTRKRISRKRALPDLSPNCVKRTRNHK